MKSNFDSAVESALTKEFAWLDDFKNPYYDYVFSSNFENSMKKIMPKAEYSYVSIGKRRVRKLIIVALAAILATVVTGCAFAVHYIIEWNETQNVNQITLDVTFDSNDTQNNREIIPGLPETPNGFAITDQFSDDCACLVSYSDSSGSEINFTRCNDLENMSVSIDNEDTVLKEISINGYKGYTYIKDNVNIIYWANTSCFYVLQGTCEMDILIKMAKSVNSN